MKTAEHFDVLVLGAGVAGLSTAIFCLKNALSVAVVERNEVPSHRPGETLHSGALSILKSMGVAQEFLSQGFIEYDGIWSNATGSWHETRLGGGKHERWVGYQVDRVKLSQILIQRVKELGGTFYCPESAREVHVAEARVIGIQTESSKVAASFVVDGCGSSHWLARRLGLAIKTFSDQLIVEHGYESENSLENSRLPQFQVSESGWLWYAKVAEDRYAWVKHDKKNEFPLKGKRADVTWRVVQKTAGSGYVLVGDAACVSDPSTSHGMLKALFSGGQAAQCITESLNTPSLEEHFTTLYDSQIRTAFVRDWRALNSKSPNQIFV